MTRSGPHQAMSVACHGPVLTPFTRCLLAGERRQIDVTIDNQCLAWRFRLLDLRSSSRSVCGDIHRKRPTITPDVRNPPAAGPGQRRRTAAQRPGNPRPCAFRATCALSGRSRRRRAVPGVRPHGGLATPTARDAAAAHDNGPAPGPDDQAWGASCTCVVGQIGTYGLFPLATSALGPARRASPATARMRRPRPGGTGPGRSGRAVAGRGPSDRGRRPPRAGWRSTVRPRTRRRRG
jgi:hypothetical protein